MSISEMAAAIEAAASYLREHPEAGAGTDSPASAEVERGLRIRVDGPAGQIVTDSARSWPGPSSTRRWAACSAGRSSHLWRWCSAEGRSLTVDVPSA